MDRKKEKGGKEEEMLQELPKLQDQLFCMNRWESTLMAASIISNTIDSVSMGISLSFPGENLTWVWEWKTILLQ